MSPKRKIKSDSSGENSSGGRRLRPYFFVAAFIAVLSAGAGIFYYTTYVAPFHRVIVTVDNQTVRMDYFIKRIRMSGSDQALTLQQVAYEQIVKLLAPEYDIVASPSEVDEQLRNEAVSSTNITSNSGFTEWYSNRLKTTGLSDAEYRDIIRTNLLAVRLLQRLAENLPTVTAQVHVYTIITASPADALSAAARVTAGESFSDVAGEISLDASTKSRGGDLGWLPRGVTPYDDVIFSLAAGQTSKPVAIDPGSPDTSQYAIFWVKEWDPERIIDPGPMSVLRSRALYNVIQEEIPKRVKYTYTPAQAAWVEKQVNNKTGK